MIILIADPYYLFGTIAQHQQLFAEAVQRNFFRAGYIGEEKILLFFPVFRGIGQQDMIKGENGVQGMMEPHHAFAQRRILRKNLCYASAGVFWV